MCDIKVHIIIAQVFVFIFFRMGKSANQKERSADFWRSRKASERLGLKMLPLDEEALQRIELNGRSYFATPEHPFEWDIDEWTLSADHRRCIEINKDKSFWFVENEKAFYLMCEHLIIQKEIAIDLEMSDDFSFHKISCLIQISTPTQDFVVDSIKLYNLIPNLSEILLKPSILKVVFSPNDILSLQRDFKLRVYPLIDFQNVFQDFKMLPQLPSFKHVVEDFLSVENYEVDKKYQLFNWRLRPLPQDAIHYARDDSRLLLECWEKFKFVHADFIKSSLFNYKHHRDLMLKSYRYPVIQDYNFYFNRAWEIADVKLKERFVPNDTIIFKDVHAWRYNTAKLTDNNVQNLFTDLDALKFCVMKPTNIDMLHNISFKFECLSSDAKNSLLSIICRYNNGQSAVEAVPPGKSVFTENPVETQVTTSPEVTTSNVETEIIVVNKCITCERGLDCDNCNQKGVNNPFNIVAYDSQGTRFTMSDYLNYKVTDKTLKNYFAKKRKLLNQICINDHREKHGLNPLKFRKNRGKKSRERYLNYVMKKKM